MHILTETSYAQMAKNVPVVILAGGKGTRLGEETQNLIPKPLIQIGEEKGAPKTLIDCIIDSFLIQGFKNFIIATGHLGEQLGKRKYNVGFFQQPHDFQIMHFPTGEHTQTCGRIMRVRKAVEEMLPDPAYPFIVTFGDGLCNVNMLDAVSEHIAMNSIYDRYVTLTAVRPPARFGVMKTVGNKVVDFEEKGQMDDYVNGGYYICGLELFEWLENAPNAGYDQKSFETDILPVLAHSDRLGAFHHDGYFQMVDTPRDLSHARGAFQGGLSLNGKFPWLNWTLVDIAKRAWEDSFYENK